ncbi:MAG TPA: multidrug ABC transporter ATP-binding protein [Clostridiales bacterium]|nr:multidrug ABC transporter ATP-binding protein [Clostridiales bacterium]
MNDHQPEYTLEVKGLSKSYGRREALKGISFHAEPGEVFALIGPNGAGKTTALRIIATLLRPSGGDALVCGRSIRENPDDVRALITYLPDEAGAYKNMKGLEYLKFMAALYLDDPSKQHLCVERAVQISDLGERISDKIGSYSKGMTRKLLLARAVMTSPKLAVLDEPTSGLDVLNALEIRKVIRKLTEEGTTFLISSHNMLEIEFLSDRVGIINQGVIYATGSPETLKREYQGKNLEEVFAKAVQK